MLIQNINNPLRHDFKQKHLWVKKATGLGVMEFFLRFMAWLYLKDNTYHNSQMCIVTGPNQDIAIKLIKRMKALFELHNIIFANKETVLELNGCTIEAFHQITWMPIVLWIIPNSYYWMKVIFSENQNKRMLGMYQKDTLQNQIPS